MTLLPLHFPLTLIPLHSFADTPSRTLLRLPSLPQRKALETTQVITRKTLKLS